MSKLDLSTPWQEVRDTIRKEIPKAVYWHDKKRGGEEAEQQKRDVMAEKLCKDPEHKNVLTPVIDYTSPDGNNWLLYYTGRYIDVGNNHTGVAWSPRKIPWFETVTSAGFFFGGDDNDDTILVVIPHFLYRYNERMELGISSGREQLLEFTRRNVYIAINDKDGNYVTYEKDGQTHFYIAMQDGLGMGVVMEDGHRYEVRSFIPLSWMRKDQKRIAKPLLDELKREVGNMIDNARKDWEAEDGLPEWWNSEYDGWHQRVQDYYYDKAFDRLTGHSKDKESYLAMLLYLVRIMRAVTLGKLKNDPDGKLVTRAANGAVGKIQNAKNDPVMLMIMGKHPDVKYPEAATTAALMLSISEFLNCNVTFEEVTQKTKEIEEFNNKHLNKNESMNSMMMAALKKCLKKNGAKNFNTLVSNFCKGDPDSYIAQAEVEYVVSRVAAVANGDNEREKYREANKAWLSLVIDNDWSNILKPYIGRYGKELVKMSICDMIDHDSWWSPATNSNLTAKGDDYLKKLEEALQSIDDDINEKIFNDESLNDLLPGHGKQAETTAPSASADGNATPMASTTAPVSGASASDNSQVSTGVSGGEPAPCDIPDLIDFGAVTYKGQFCPPDIALKSADNMSAYLRQMQQCMENLQVFVNDHLKESEIQKACEKKDATIERTEKQLIEEKGKRIKITLERDQARADYNLKSSEYDKMKREKEQLEKDKESLLKRYNELEKALEEAKQKSQEFLPRKKTIALSRLTKFANMGTFDKPSKSCQLLINDIFPLVDVLVDMNR